MKKKGGLFLLVGLMVLGLMITGCGGGTESGVTENGDVEEIEAKAGEEIKLKFNYFSMETIPPGIASKQAMEKIEEETGGKVKFDSYFGGTYLSYDDSIQGVAKGVVDIALIESGQLATLFDLNQVFCKPMENTPPDRVGMTNVFRELIKNVPEINEELEEVGLRWIAISALAPYNLHTVNKAVRSPEDIKGMKLESLGDAVEYVSSLGASAISLDPGDYYMSLERGLVEGQFTHWAVLDLFRTCELCKYHTIFGSNPERGPEHGGLYAPAMGYVINLETWNSLPADIQEIIEKHFNWAGEEKIRLDVEVVNNALNYAEDNNDTFIYLSEEERNAWVEYMKPVNEKWIKETEEKGWPAQKAYDEFMRLLDEYN